MGSQFDCKNLSSLVHLVYNSETIEQVLEPCFCDPSVSFLSEVYLG